MDELVIQLTPQMLLLIPIVAAIVQVVKQLKAIEKYTKWLPFVAIGVAYGLAMATNVADPILPSVIIGLAASGGYDAVKQ